MNEIIILFQASIICFRTNILDYCTLLLLLLLSLEGWLFIVLINCFLYSDVLFLFFTTFWEFLRTNARLNVWINANKNIWLDISPNVYLKVLEFEMRKIPLFGLHLLVHYTIYYFERRDIIILQVLLKGQC